MVSTQWNWGTVKLHGVSLTALVRSGPKHGDTYLAASATSLQSWGTVLRAEAEGSNYIYLFHQVNKVNFESNLKQIFFICRIDFWFVEFVTKVLNFMTANLPPSSPPTTTAERQAPILHLWSLGPEAVLIASVIFRHICFIFFCLSFNQKWFATDH